MSSPSWGIVRVLQHMPVTVAPNSGTSPRGITGAGNYDNHPDVIWTSTEKLMTRGVARGVVPW
ncbi:hypothetical protein A5660_18705 [Mycobacterium alsense]|nr:hypothetical protein A5660_18705 [Mycobacterium alsense]